MVTFGYIMLAGMALVLIWGLCVEARDSWKEVRQWVKRK